MPFIVMTVFTLCLYGPAMLLLCAVTPWKGFRLASVRHRGQRYTTLHLATLDRIGKLSRGRATRFHRSFIYQLTKAINDEPYPVFFISHLLRPAHLRSMNVMLSASATHRWHCRTIPLSSYVRTGIRMQTLIQEWRWITVPPTGVLVVIRPRR